MPLHFVSILKYYEVLIGKGSRGEGREGIEREARRKRKDRVSQIIAESLPFLGPSRHFGLRADASSNQVIVTGSCPWGHRGVASVTSALRLESRGHYCYR